ncbi:UBX domain-containing protein [Cryptosporidium muris RN66]|uniref:UBX domain-containing protein n=1 Tax=Cryptosporidium muris (strain RN66) TaxID=441375 RepID=B6AAH9_CRYMR|nr:UBX domain-containing protein [Cryptosporidium muris RN66]EEA05220.1 UBX domain-containing protein [Cryptosporidium muris RN66]|eukprot:XP_002139569.1 UBX domain-containing protein [Cryptosporidium muris RN66]
MIEESSNNDSLIATFCEITGCNATKSSEILESTNWNLENALILYYEENNNEINEITNDNTEQKVEISNNHEINRQHKSIYENLLKYINITINFFINTIYGVSSFITSIFTIHNEQSISRQINMRISPETSITNAQFEADRKLRQEQDQEYLDSLYKDSLKKEKLLMKQRTQQLIIDRRKELKEYFNNEKEHINEPISTVCIRLPDGSKFQRIFCINDPVFKIYEWVESLGADETKLIPNNFSLRMSRSTSIEIDRTYNNKDTTLKELGLYPNVVLLLHLQNDEDDE